MIPGITLTEKQWQAQVIELAHWRRWRTYHPHDSRRSTPGWPDLAMIRHGRFIVAELKAEHGQLTTEQKQWLTDLSACPGIETFVWKPSDWRTLQTVLA